MNAVDRDARLTLNTRAFRKGLARWTDPDQTLYEQALERVILSHLFQPRAPRKKNKTRRAKSKSNDRPGARLIRLLRLQPEEESRLIRVDHGECQVQHSGQRSSAYDVKYSAGKQVLLIRLGATLTDEIYMDQYRSVQSYIVSFGPSSLILDLSRVRKFDLSYPFLLEIGEMKPAIPPPMSRYVVAPQPHVYGAARIVETLRSLGPAPIRTVRNIEEAYKDLGVRGSDFAPIEFTG